MDWGEINTSITECRVWLSDYPFSLLLALFLPFFAIAILRRIYPRFSLFIALAVISCLSVFTAGSRDLIPLILSADMILALVAFVDILSTPRVKGLQFQREVLRVASIQKDHHVTVTVTNNKRRSVHVRIRDDRPQDFTSKPDKFSMKLGARSRTALKYEFQASCRGAYQLKCVHLQIRSRLGLWMRTVHVPLVSEIHVYPDMKQLGEYAILARTNRLSLMGVKRTRRIGQDNEFERLRDYTQDDNHRFIDWRATARRNKLTVQDFQTNQSQRIIFMLDCGRMMTNEASGLSLLDHSLNSMLMLSYVALKQGDSVGLLCFSDKVHQYVPPKGGMKHMNQLLHSAFDRKPNLVESRYDQAFLHLANHCHKRSLVVLVSNVIDEVNSVQIRQYLSSLVGRHLPLGVLLRDHQIFDAADNPARDVSQVYRAGAAAEILTWRHQALVDLERSGVMALDVFPEDMTAPLVNKYLEIKARHLL